MKKALAALVIVVVSGCFRTRIERRDVPVDTGIPLTFGDEGGTPLTWDFGDGTPPVVAAQVTKAFPRGGHYTVRGKDGDRLAWQIDLDAIPRPVTRAIPGDASWAIFAPRVKEDFVGSLDFFESAFGSSNLQSLIDGTVLPSLAVDSTTLGRLVDPLEGLGAFTLPGLDATVALLGVVDEQAALQELSARGRTVDLGDAAVGLELRDGSRAMMFADRGYLYAVFPRTADDAGRVMKRVRAADALGLEQGPAHRALPAEPIGCLVVLGAPKDKTELPIDALWATLQLKGREAHLQGRLISSDPLWQLQGVQPAALFAKAWEGPIAAVSVKLPAGLLRSVLDKGSPEREASRQRLLSHGIDVERMVKALTGEVGGLMWFDAEGFLRNLIDGTERPEPRGAALVEVAVSDGAPWELAVGQMLEVFLPVKPRMQQRSDGTVWSARMLGQDAALTVGKKTMRLELGSGLKGRTLVDLSAQLSQRFDGAFGKGHASLLLDVGRLRAELETPRMIEGLDPMRVVTVQGFASAFLDRLTPLDHVLLDLAPMKDGAKISGRIVLREKER